MKYKELERENNPSYRIREMGGKALSTSELLAVGLWIGDSDQANALASLYSEYGGLSKIPRHRIMEIKGFGEGYADAILAIIELARREVMQAKPIRPKISCPQDAFELVRDMTQLEVEEMRVMLLNTRNEVLKIVTVTRGTVDGGSFRGADLFRDAIRENATSVLFVHNHPSGDPMPSPADVGTTRTAVSMSKMLDIEVLDHLVIGHNNFKSLKEAGLGF